MSVDGAIPLVLMDEFDTHDLRWLAEFLGPMYDAEYMINGAIHRLGRTIFVFAGGTSSSYQAFAHQTESRANLKGPDFTSRLRGFLNIRGIDPSNSEISDEMKPSDELKDSTYLIRRAILLRSLLEGGYTGLLNSATGQANVSPGVVGALLYGGGYRHGARSLEAILAMSDLRKATFFSVAQLPSRDLLESQLVDPGRFSRELSRGESQARIFDVEALARVIHNAWYSRKSELGFSYGADRDDSARLHPLMVSYSELHDSDRELSRVPARVILPKLEDVGLPPNASSEAMLDWISNLTSESRLKLYVLEHEMWMRHRLLLGYECSERGDEMLRLNRGIVPYESLRDDDRSQGQRIVDSVLCFLSDQVTPDLVKHGEEPSIR
jgi:RyR domain